MHAAILRCSTELREIDKALTKLGRRCNNQGYDGTHCDGLGKGEGLLMCFGSS